jgi:pyruvate dehydrogenase E2 component (dihydrolipoyllysine-residue acetyltransferase)
MADIIEMPKLSDTMTVGTLVKWLKKEGDAVKSGDMLAEVETDKATMEFRAFDKGTLLKHLVSAGAQVKLGQPVAILGNAGEDISELVAKAGTAAPAAPPDAKGAATAETAREEVEQAPAPQTNVPPAPPTPRSTETYRPPVARPVSRANILMRTEQGAEEIPGRAAEPKGRAGADGSGDNGRVLASPYVRKVARERGIDLAGAQGSGDHGRILPSDLDALVSRADAAPQAQQRSVALAAPGLAPPEARPLSPMRKTIARRLTEAKKTVPHFYLTIDVDAEALVALRERINKELAAERPKNAPDATKDGDGPAAGPSKISLNDLLIKACASALVRVPECNAQFSEQALLIHKRVDISVAVAIPDGLITPVVRDADRKSVVAIAREVRDLASRARAKKLKPEEMTDGTFSISNLGMFGIDEFSAVINPPEGAILAVGQVRDEPVVKEGVVKPGKKLAMTLSCDHRVIDGAVGAAFLAELRSLLERPMRILTG